MHVELGPTKLNGLREPSKVQTEHIRSIDISRLLKPLGRHGVADLAAVDDAIRFHLAQ